MTIILLGLDGLSLEHIHSSIQRTSLPNFRRLLSEGVCSAMSSVYPYVTAPAWTTIFSGVNPGKHGVFDMFDVANGRMKTPNMRSAEIPFLWDYVSWANRQVLVMGVPFVYPAPKVNGTFVSGRFAPRLSCFPEDLPSTYDCSGFGYEELPTERSIEQVMIDGAKRVSSRLLQDLKKRIDVSLRLIDSHSWDMVVIVDSLPDELYHFSFDDTELVDTMFRMLDSWIGELLRRLDVDDSLLLVSDHGFTSVQGVLFMNEWLLSKGYIGQLRTSPFSGRLGVNWDLLRRQGLASSMYRLLSKSFPKVLGRLQAHLAEGMTIDPVLLTLTAKAVALNINEPVAWIRVSNDDGSTIPALLTELGELVKAGLIKNVLRSDQVFEGKYATRALGQILIESNDGWAIDCFRLNQGKVVGPPLWTKKGVHHRDGTFILLNKSASSLRRLPKICDVTPTLLALAKLPLLSYFDGISVVNLRGRTPSTLTLNVP